MRKKTSIVIIFLLMLIFVTLTACSSKSSETDSSDLIIDKEYNQNKENNEDNGGSFEDIIEDETEIELPVGIPSPLSGIYAEEEKINRRPVAVMFDNDPKARWQAGLSQAEVVYEFLVEPPYTRYMGIFLLNEPELIGPVRSARPYFIATLLEYDPLYVRVGGSEQAIADVKKYKVADIDGLYSGAFWRNTKTGKRAPNNLYTSMEGIRKEQRRLKYDEIGDYKGFNFNDIDYNIEGKEASEVLIKYYQNNTTRYEYDQENKVYKRYKDGKLHIDEIDNEVIVAKMFLYLKLRLKL